MVYWLSIFACQASNLQRSIVTRTTKDQKHEFGACSRSWRDWWCVSSPSWIMPVWHPDTMAKRLYDAGQRECFCFRDSGPDHYDTTLCKQLDLSTESRALDGLACSQLRNMTILMSQVMSHIRWTKNKLRSLMLTIGIRAAEWRWTSTRIFWKLQKRISPNPTLRWGIS